MADRVAPMSAIGQLEASLDTIDPSTIKRGVRLFVFVVDKMLKVYARWETNINPVLPAGVAAALSTLIAALADIDALNRPGPE